MVTRIATASANQALVTRMLEQQQRVNDDQTQVSTGFKSQDYTGISGDSFQLLNIENERARLQRYLSINTVFPSSRVANLVDINLPNITATYTNTTVPSTGKNVTQVTGTVGNFVTQTLDQTQTGNLIFSNVGSNGKITASTPGAFKSI